MLVTNGIDEKNITKGAYEQIYKPLGYKPIVVIPFEEKKQEDVITETKIEEPIKEEIKEEEPKKEEIKEKKKEETVSQKKTPKKYKK